MNRFFIIAVPFVSLFAACSTVSSQKADSFASAATSVKTQTDQAFAAVNALTDPEILKHAASQPTLTDSNFFQVLDQASIAHWDNEFAALQSYGQHLSQLTSGKSTQEYEDAMAGLAGQINGVDETLKQGDLVSAPLGTAFTKLSSVILGAKAQHDALKIVAATDPAIQDILNNMAAQIGASTEDGIRGTVTVNWLTLKNEKKLEFLGAKPGPDRLAIATAYSKLLDQQRDQDLALVTLQRSILALGRAHHALATGDDFEVTKAIGNLDGGLKDIQALYQKFDAARPKQ